MKKFWLVLIIVIIGILPFILKKPPKTIPEVETSLSSEEATQSNLPNPRKNRDRELFRTPRKEVSEKAQVPATCRPMWNQLLTLELGEKDFWKSPEKIPKAGECIPPKELKNTQEQYLKLCGLEEAQKKLDEQAKSQCKVALFYYRAAINDYLTRDQDLHAISDPKVLVDKLFTRFFSSPIQGAEIAERLLEVRPDYYPALQAATIGRILGAESKTTEIPDSQKIDAWIERLKQLDPDDPQNQELDIFSGVLVKKDPLSVREKAYEIYKSQPDSFMGAYYLAWAEYRMGDPEKGSYWLEEAKRIAPDNPAVRATYEARNKNPGFYKETDPKKRSIFRTDFFFRIEDPDFRF